MPRLPLLAILAVLALPSTATAQGGTPPGDPDQVPSNPCERELLDLLCPDLRMSPPYDLKIDREIEPGRVFLRAANSINSRGTGPAELFATRRGRYTATAVQKIWREGGAPMTVRTGAKVVFKFIPKQGRYWKFENAAKFELWTVDAMLRPLRRVRTGPKLIYCLRDLSRTRRSKASPRRFYYPSCSKDGQMKRVTLGTSVGWSDIYPATYHENWIDVTGLKGTFAFKHIADPENGIWESDETNNESITIVQLPSGKARTRRSASGEDPYSKVE